MRSALKRSAAFLAVAFLLTGPASPDAGLSFPDLHLNPCPGGACVSRVEGLPRAEVLSAVDGDTLRVRWEGRETRLRYFGVNTPERGRPCYEEATRRNEALAGREVLLVFEGRTRDVHGRLLAYVFTPEGLSLESALVAEGLGRAWTRDGRWRDGMEALEKEAKRSRRGCLWEKPAKTARRRGKKHRPE